MWNWLEPDTAITIKAMLNHAAVAVAALVIFGLFGLFLKVFPPLVSMEPLVVKVLVWVDHAALIATFAILARDLLVRLYNDRVRLKLCIAF